MWRLIFLCTLLLAHFTVAASIPRSTSQKPLMPEQWQTKLSQASVVLEFTEIGSDEHKRFEIPLHTQVSSATGLPSRLSTLEMKSVITKEGRSAPLNELEDVLCRVKPKLSVEETAAIKSGMIARVYPWFSVKDGRIQMEKEPASRWFLGGREIESYECR